MLFQTNPMNIARNIAYSQELYKERKKKIAPKKCTNLIIIIIIYNMSY